MRTTNGTTNGTPKMANAGNFFKDWREYVL